MPVDKEFVTPVELVVSHGRDSVWCLSPALSRALPPALPFLKLDFSLILPCFLELNPAFDIWAVSHQLTLSIPHSPLSLPPSHSPSSSPLLPPSLLLISQGGPQNIWL